MSAAKDNPLSELVPPLRPPTVAVPSRRRLTAVEATATSRPYMHIVLVSIVLGLFTIVLFHKVPTAGVNLLIATVLVLASAGLLIYTTRASLPKRNLLLMITASLFAALFTWRSSDALRTLNFLLVLLLAGIVLSPTFTQGFHLTFSRAALALRQSFTNLLAGAYRLLEEFPWQAFSSGPNILAVRSGIRGALLSLPLLLLFGYLFSSADVRFDSLVDLMVAGFVGNIAGQTLWFLIGAWAAAGLLRMAALGIPAAQGSAAPKSSLRLHPLEGTVCLTLLNLLFFVFVCLQLPYLFGGIGHVATAPGLTLAEYARHGFFELAAVAALVLPLLLTADWLLSPETTAGERRLFRISCCVLLLLVGVIMASALQRMVVYMQQYGLTQLRLFVSAFILMLAVLSVWFGATVLRGRREIFLAGAIGIGCLFAAGLQFLNPDARIAHYNLQRCRAGSECDFEYLARLSTDALPAIAAELRRGDIPNANLLIEMLQKQHTFSADEPWQSWNWSRSRGREVIRALSH